IVSAVDLCVIVILALVQRVDEVVQTLVENIRQWIELQDLKRDRIHALLRNLVPLEGIAHQLAVLRSRSQRIVHDQRSPLIGIGLAEVSVPLCQRRHRSSYRKRHPLAEILIGEHKEKLVLYDRAVNQTAELVELVRRPRRPLLAKQRIGGGYLA